MERVACGPLYCYRCSVKGRMPVDLNRLILGKSYNSTKVFRTAQHVVQAISVSYTHLTLPTNSLV